MTRLSAQERKMLAELSKRAEEEDEKDSNLELWVETKGGHKVKLTGAKASAFARKHDLDLDGDDGQEDVDDVDEPELGSDAGPARGAGYFVGKKRG